MSNNKSLTTEETFNLAVKNHQEGKTDIAQKLYLQVLRIKPNHSQAHNNLGAIFKQLREFKKAKECFEKAIAINPDYADAHNNLGVVLQELGDLQKAKDCYEKAIEINPNYVEAHYNLGVIFKELDENQKAKSCYEKAIEINPNFAEAHYNLGAIFKELGENQKAKDCYEKAIEINPNYTDAHNNLGAVFQELGKYPKAINCFEKAIKIDPKHINAHNNHGSVFNELGEIKKSIDCYEKAIQIDPNNEISLYGLGIVLFSIKQYKNASERFKISNYKNSKSFLLNCFYKLDDKSNFLKELDSQIEQGEINAVIGSLSSRSEIKFGVKKLNPFCEDPLKHVLKKNLTEQYNFKKIFAEPIKNVLEKGMYSARPQDLLTNGHQTAGNLFKEKNDFLDKIKDIIHLEVDKYHDHFKESNEGFIKNWPKSYNINAWLVSMKNGGKLDPHMHDFGWLSGSIYINVPSKLQTDSGNLVVCIDDQVQEENNSPKKMMDVVTGSLCLFPSSLYHYTIPFESEEDRVVLAFDVISGDRNIKV